VFDISNKKIIIAILMVLVLAFSGNFVFAFQASNVVKEDVSAYTIGASKTNKIVLNIVLPNATGSAAADVLIHNGATSSWTGDDLISFLSLGNIHAEAFARQDGNCSAGYVEGNSDIIVDDDNDGVYTSASDNVLYTGGSSDTYSAGDALNIFPVNPSQRIAINGADTTFVNSDCILIDDDGDDVWTSAADTVVDADGTATAASGSPGADDSKSAGDVLNPLAPTSTYPTLSLEGGDQAYATGEAIVLDLDNDSKYTPASADDCSYYNGADSPSHGDALSADFTNIYWIDDDHDSQYDSGEAIINSTNGTLDDWDTVLVNGNADLVSFFSQSDHKYSDTHNSHSIDTYDVEESIIISSDSNLDDGEIVKSGEADTKVFANEIAAIESGSSNNGAYDDGELIMNSSNGAIIKSGDGDFQNFVAGDDILFDDSDGGNEYDAGTDDIFIDDDEDGVYTSAADAEADCDGSTSTNKGTCDSHSEGDALVSMGDNKVDWDDNDAADGVYLCTDDLSNPTAIRVDLNQDCTDNGGNDGTYLLGSAAATTKVTNKWAFVDSDADGLLDNGEDLYIEETAGSSTYSAGADEVLVDGTGALNAGDSGLGIQNDAEVGYLDGDHDSSYTDYEILIDLGDGNSLANDANVPITAQGLQKATGDWDVIDAVLLNSSAVYCDNDHDDAYDNTEAIIVSGTAGQLNTGDTVETSGTCDLLDFTAGSSSNDRRLAFSDDNNDGDYSTGEAIIQETSGDADTTLESTDTIFLSGSADLDGDWTTANNADGPLVHTSTGVFVATNDVCKEVVDGGLTYSDGTADTKILDEGGAISNGATLALLDGTGNLVYNDENSNNEWDNGEDIITENYAGEFTWSAAADTKLDADSLDVDCSGMSAGDTITLLDNTTNLVFYDVNTNSDWNTGEDIILENHVGELTYSDIADTVVVNGGDSISAGTTLCDFPTTYKYVDDSEDDTFDSSEDIYNDVGANVNVTDKAEDELNVFIVKNIGDQDRSELTVKAWVDDGDGVFEPGSDDSALGAGTGSYDASINGWIWTGLSEAIPASGLRIFVSVDTGAGVTDGATLRFQIPILIDSDSDGDYDAGEEGVFVASNNDGPTDANVTNADSQTIDITGPNITSVTINGTLVTVVFNENIVHSGTKTYNSDGSGTAGNTINETFVSYTDGAGGSASIVAGNPTVSANDTLVYTLDGFATFSATLGAQTNKFYDYAGNAVGTAAVTSTGAPDEHIDLSSGWNLISTPRVLDNSTWSDVIAYYDGLNWSIAYTYDNGWVQVTSNYTLDPLEAIYINITEADELAFFYKKATPGPNCVYPSRSLTSGWNLVSLNENISTKWTTALDDLEVVSGESNDYKGLSKILSPSPPNANYYLEASSKYEDDSGSNMDEYEGYWVLMERADTLTGQRCD